ncbi:DUF2786 domain-containing protein [Streptomyces sp. NPDC059009]|uniref:DUF2786 domain-containing protein n=1 Tax=Streptomyces sp. NPDC059009 TaxID=3346694 RepID=UPI0036B8DAE5
MPEDGKLAKIRALLAKAEDPAASEEEAQAYFAKAADLMAKYGIERAMLTLNTPDADKISFRLIKIEGSYVEERRLMAAYIAKALSVEPLLSRTRLPGEKRFSYYLEMYGFESDLERVEMLYTSLSLQASNGLRGTRPEWWESTTLTAHRKAWLRGFAFTVSERLKAAEGRAKKEAEAEHGSSVALVLADRAALAKKAADDANPDVSDYKPRFRSSNAFDQGQAAGRSADIGATRLTGRRNAITA